MKNKRIMIIGGTGALGKQLTNRWDEKNISKTIISYWRR